MPSVELEVEVKAEFLPINEEWQAKVSPTIVYFFQGHARCPDCFLVTQVPELKPITDPEWVARLEKPPVPGEADAAGACPECGNVAFLIVEPQAIPVDVTHYSAKSFPEINSSMETIIWRVQRLVEDLHKQVRSGEPVRLYNRVQIEGLEEGGEPDDDEQSPDT